MVEEKAAEPVPPGTKTKEEKANELIANVMATGMLKAAEDTKLALTLNIKSLKDELTQQKSDQSDMYYYLNKKCDDSYEVISSLEEQLLTEQADREVSEKMYEQSVEHLQLELAEEKHTLGSKVAKLEKELEGIQKFIKQKGSMEKEITTLNRSLEKERHNLKAVVADMEQQWTLERNRLRKQGEKDVAAVRLEYDKGLTDRLAEKTQETMLRNARIEEEMSFQSKQADKVLEYNQGVIDEDKDLKVNLKLSRAMEAELLEKMAVYQRTIKKQNETMKELKTDYEKNENRLAKNEEEMRTLRRASRTGTAASGGPKESTMLDDVWTYLSDEFQSLGIKGGSHDEESKSSSLTKKEREEQFLSMMKKLLQKFPELGRLLGNVSPRGGGDQQHRKSPGLSIFPAMSPPGKGGKASAAKKLEKLFNNHLQSVATQTNESSVGNVLNEESLWLTDRRDFQAQNSLSYYSQNDFSNSIVSHEGNALAGNSSLVDNDLSVKSTSAVPPSKSTRKGNFGSTHRPRLQGGFSRMKESSPIASSSASVGSSKSGGKTVPVDMRFFSETSSNARQPLGEFVSKIPGITGQKKAIVGNPDFGGRGSPQSSVSMSPRDRDDNSTIMTISPRHGDDMIDDI